MKRSARFMEPGSNAWKDMENMINLKKEFTKEMRDFWRQCRFRRGEKNFRHLVLDGYHNPDFLELCRYGEEYKGKIIYQINAYGRSVGFFAEFLFTLIRLFFASERGFVPYVNWGEEFLYYEAKGVDHVYNGFLYYFEPVSEVTNIQKAAYVLHANDDHIHDVQNQLNTHGYAATAEYMDALSNMVKKYIRYNEKTLAYLEKGYDGLIGDKKALAVHFRGTDYRRQYNNHPVFVTLEEQIETVHELMGKKGYEVVFLATDEQEAVETFRKEFGAALRVFEDTWRASGEDESVAYSHSNRKEHHYLLGLEVVRDQYMLTRCAGLVGGISNLTLSARMMRKAWYEKGYEDLVIIDHDLCRNQHNFCDASH